MESTAAPRPTFVAIVSVFASIVRASASSRYPRSRIDAAHGFATVNWIKPIYGEDRLEVEKSAVVIFLEDRMSLELFNSLATFGTFLVISATAIAALYQLRHARQPT